MLMIINYICQCNYAYFELLLFTAPDNATYFFLEQLFYFRVDILKTVTIEIWKIEMFLAKYAPHPL